MNHSIQHNARRTLLIVFLLACFGVSCKPANAYTPGSPVVVEMIDKGISYLEKLSPKDVTAGGWGGEEFHPVVIGYAHIKAQHNPESAVVLRGVRVAQQLAGRVRGSGNRLKRGTDTKDKSTYALSICILLLCEADSKKYKSDIEALRDALFRMQQPTGGFGYPNELQGDISQVQYVVLAMWTMDQKGIEVGADILNRVHAYLMRVQDIGGSWPYRATDPGAGKGLIKQGTKYMSHSTALAGASSVLIAGDYFDMWQKGKGKDERLEGLPKAVMIANELRKIDNKRAPKVARDQILSSVDHMNQYRRKNKYDRTKGGTWHYYSLYSLERFESFHEFATENVNAEPNWYNSAVDSLKADQDASGGWAIKDNAASPPPIATAFAILFLTRSTQQAIAANRSGTMTGGRSLPSDTKNMRNAKGKLVGAAVTNSVNGLLDLLDSDGATDLDESTIPEGLALSDKPQELADQLKRLKRMIRGGPWQSRRAAARLLGQSSNLDVAPSLIFALSDPDSVVRREARNGLRFVSRKFDGFGMPDEPSRKDIELAVESWKRWYLDVNPSYEFLDL